MLLPVMSNDMSHHPSRFQNIDSHNSKTFPCHIFETIFIDLLHSSLYPKMLDLTQKVKHISNSFDHPSFNLQADILTA